MNLPHSPYTSTKRAFKEQSLTILPSSEMDLEDIKSLKSKIYEELCPRLANWYKKHPESFDNEFHGPKGQNPERRIFYSVRTLEKALVGCGGLVQKNPKKFPDIGELADIYLLADYRGRGLGQVLIEDLIKKAKKIGFESLYLTTRKEFEAATHIYQKLGFKETENKKFKSKNSISWELKL